MIAIHRRMSYLACSTLVAGLTAAASLHAQKSHDALARARHAAKQQNQRVLLLLQGKRSPVADQLEAALGEYRKLGKLLKYEYQLAAQPASSLAGRHLRKTLRLPEHLALPTLVALDTKDRVLGTLQASAMIADKGEGLDTAALRGFLEANQAEALDAKRVLAQAIDLAKKSKRKVFVYLSAPW